MATTAPTARPDGGAATTPLRRLGATLRASLRNGDVIRWLGRGGAVVPLLLLLLVLAELIVKAIPAIRFGGLSFFTSTKWNFGAQYGKSVTSDGVTHLPGEEFGALPEILGTLATSAIALIIAVPISIGAALAIVERLPKRLASVVGVFLELLAGVPSVVIGLWGALTFGPFIAHHIAPIIANNAPELAALLRRRHRQRAGTADLRPGSRGHGDPDRCRHLARPDPRRAAAAARRRDRAGHVRLRSAPAGSRCRGSAPASSGPSCSAWAGRWARQSLSPWSAAWRSAACPRTCTQS